jgi:hypothetical protein
MDVQLTKRQIYYKKYFLDRKEFYKSKEYIAKKREYDAKYYRTVRKPKLKLKAV